MRFHSTDHKGQTRAEKAFITFGEDGSPEDGIPRFTTTQKEDGLHVRAVIDIPKDGIELWGMFWALSAHRVDGGRIAPETIAFWLSQNGKRISTLEARALDAMDQQFVTTLREEIALNKERINSA